MEGTESIVRWIDEIDWIREGGRGRTEHERDRKVDECRYGYD